jgi:5-methylcytosine-specific restriction endonuclease McrA
MRLVISGAYADDWQAISRRVKEEAGNRCVRCRHPFDRDGRPLPCTDDCDRSRGRTVTVLIVGEAPHDVGPGLNYGVHHFDGNKSNCAWWNLMPLCNSCHLSVQARVIPERAWLFEHSEWAKPYVAGFYAYWFVEGLIRTQAQVLADVDLYLAVGQPWLYPDREEEARRLRGAW